MLGKFKVMIMILTYKLLLTLMCKTCLGKTFGLLYDHEFLRQVLSLPDSCHLKSSETQNSIRGIIDGDVFNNDVIFSLSGQNHLLQEVMKANGSKFYSFDTSLENLKNRLRHSPFVDCIEQNRLHYQATKFLIYSLSLQGLALISEDSYCSQAFIQPLLKEIREAEYSQRVGFLIRHHAMHLNRESLLKNFLYSVKTANTPVIVLLVRKKYHLSIFKAAASYSLLGSTQLWLVPSFDDEMISELTPIKLLTFQDRSNIRSYRNLKYTIPQLVTKYKELEIACSKFEDSCVLPRLYQGIRKFEEVNTTEYALTIRYRNRAKRGYKWISVPARIYDNELILESNEIHMLRSVSDKNILRRLRAVTIIDEPFTLEANTFFNPGETRCTKGLLCKRITKVGNYTRYTYTCCTGYIMQIIQLILSDLNIGMDLYIVEDSKYGDVKNGYWNGMIGDIHRGKYDIALAGLTVTKARSAVVDFTAPFAHDKVGILVKPQAVKLDFINWEFMSVLAVAMQTLLFSSVIIAIILNYLLENGVYFFNFVNGQKMYEKYYSFYESISYISGVTLQRDLGGINPKRASSRVFAVIFAFGMVVVVTTFTAVLAAKSVQNEEKDPFKGSSDERMRNPTPAFKFATTKSTAYTTFFRNGETDVLKRMGVFMEKYNVDNMEEGFQKLKNGTLHALINDYDSLYYYLSKDSSCKLRLVKDNLLSFGFGFALRKNFKWKNLIDDTIRKHRSQELYVELRKSWFTNICQPSFFVSTKSQLSINTFGGIILVLVGVSLLSLPLLYLEHMCAKHANGSIRKVFLKIFPKYDTKKDTVEITSCEETEKTPQMTNVVEMLYQIRSRNVDVLTCDKPIDHVYCGQDI